METRLSRRALLGLGATAAAAGLVPGCAHRRPHPLPVVDAGQHATIDGDRPLLASGWIPRAERDDADATLHRVVDAATDLSWLSRGDTVLLKVSLNSGHAYPATTDPWLVAAMTRLLLERGAGTVYVADKSGAEHVKVDADRRLGSSRRLATRAGLLAPAEAAGATPLFFDELDHDAYELAHPPGDHGWGDRLWLPSVLREVDHIVSLPRVASHAIAGFTLASKLVVGYLRDDSRLAFHQAGERFFELVEAVNHTPLLADRTRLVVSSGTRVLATIGPDIGHVTDPDHGLLFASTDRLAHDLLSAAWLRHNRDALAPRSARNLDETVVGLRSSIHRGWLRRHWPRREQRAIPDLLEFLPGELYGHPAITAALDRRGGRPEALQWEAVDGHPDEPLAGQLAAWIDPTA